MPALLDTAVRPVMCGVDFTSLISVSGTPHSPKPPQSSVMFDGMSLMASEALGSTLLIWRRRGEVEKRRPL